jgi:hypothetical protein
MCSILAWEAAADSSDLLGVAGEYAKVDTIIIMGAKIMEIT